MMKWSKEPLWYFLSLGLLVFGLYLVFKPDDKIEIRVTPRIVSDLVAQEEELSLKKPDSARTAELIENYIQEEIMLREAFALGYHQSDGRVRKRLLNLMRTALQDDIPEPTYNQLQAYFEKNRSDYDIGESRTLLQVYFDPNREDGVPDLNAFLEEYGNYDGLQMAGDFIPVGNRLRNYTYEQLGRGFGKEFADIVFSMNPDQWTGPVPSSAGAHFVKVLEKHPPVAARFEDVEDYLAMDYILKKTRESQDEKVEELRKKYNVVVDE